MSGRLLITGASGLLGRSLAQLAAVAGWEVLGTYHRHPLALPAVRLYALELPLGAETLIATLRPDVVVHTAYTREPASLWRVTVDGTAAIARACAASGTRLIHLSSDAIFAGRAEPYTEADAPEPLTPYGAAKAAADALVLALCPEALLVRPSLIYAAPGASTRDPFLAMALEFLEHPARGCLFTDEVRCPICVDDLAAAIVELLDRSVHGVLHLGGPTPLNRFEFGQLLIRSVGRDPAGLPAGSAGSLRRPSRVVLDSALARRMLHTEIRSPYRVLGGQYDASP